jgi:hypothetical protein
MEDARIVNYLAIRLTWQSNAPGALFLVKEPGSELGGRLDAPSSPSGYADRERSPAPAVEGRPLFQSLLNTLPKVTIFLFWR